MSEEHKSKRQLVIETVALRKQVQDLKEAALTRRRVEDALRAAERLCRLAIDQAPVGLLVVDSGGEVRLVNTWLLQLLGYASREGLQEGAGIHESSQAIIEARNRPGVPIPAQLRRADGRPVRLWLRAGDLSSSDGTSILVEADSRERSPARIVEPGDIIAR
jgi:PAS domain-containing protein